MKHKNYWIFIYGILHFTLAGQDSRIGEWQSHLPYQFGIQVTQSADKIFYATPWSILAINQSDLSHKRLSTVTGLSDTGIRTLAFDPFNQQLVVAYANSNIDLISDGEIINIPNIFLNNNISGAKQINNIWIASQKQLFLAMDFGIVELDPSQALFRSTIITKRQVNAIATIDEHLYAGTESGLYHIAVGPTTNIADFSSWDEVIGFEDMAITSLAVQNQSLLIGIAEGVYQMELSGEVNTIRNNTIEEQTAFVQQIDDYVIIGVKNTTSQEVGVSFYQNGNIVAASGSGCTTVSTGVAFDQSGRVWYADAAGAYRYSERIGGDCIRYQVDSPFSHLSSEIDVRDGLVAVASGGVSDNYTYLFGREGFYIKNGSEWFNFNESINPSIKELDLLSVFRVKFHPENTELYVGSYWAGLLRYNWVEQRYTLFNKTNSSLRGAIGDEARERITGMAFDQSKNLWVTTYGARDALHLKTDDDQWYSFRTEGNNTVTKLLIDQQGYKWMTVAGSNPGIIIYDSGEDPASARDDQQRFINSSNSLLPAGQVLSLALDRDGAVWVGTSNGPVIFDCGSEVFNNECKGIQRIVTQDNIPALLLGDQEIAAIAVDGANRKWIGTKSGLYLQSPTGEDQIAHFTTRNSPLFDNQITTLSYDEISGLMWIGTNKGIISYNSGSTLGAKAHNLSQGYAFPNPVPPGYNDVIGIRGLVEDAIVKITDINGQLVAEIKALGGQAIWDGLDQRGRKISAGVYLVFSSDDDSFNLPDTFVTKIMVLR